VESITYTLGYPCNLLISRQPNQLPTDSSGERVAIPQPGKAGNGGGRDQSSGINAGGETGLLTLLLDLLPPC
jgi:hypothetical protein